MVQTASPCRDCGTLIQRGEQPTGRIRYYCSDACKPRCTVTGCDQPQRKRSWCASHYAQWQRTQREPVPFSYKWAEKVPCRVCGSAAGRDIQSREFCSGACRFLWRKYDGKVPTSTRCIGCNVEIDLTARGKGGQRRKVSVKFCRRCKMQYSKYELTTAQLVERDGTDCGICGAPVDMALRRWQSNMCASVDHVLPRALGGTHEPGNLQLAHLHCNQVKSDRVAARGLEEVISGWRI